MNEPGEYTPMQALEELDRNWGDAYDLDYRERQFRAWRIVGTGPALAASTPEDLHAAIAADRKLAGDDLDQAVIGAYEARGIEILNVGFWQAVIREPDGQTIICRDDREALMARLRELDIEGDLPV